MEELLEEPTFFFFGRTIFFLQVMTLPPKYDDSSLSCSLNTGLNILRD